MKPLHILLKNNRQNEIYFHYLDFIQNKDYPPRWSEITVGLVVVYCGTAWLVFPRRLIRATKGLVYFFVPDHFLSSYFLPTLFWQSVPIFRQLTGPYTWQTQEVSEFLIILGVLLFLLFGLIRQSFIFQNNID